jgi:hypothetical protein
MEQMGRSLVVMGIVIVLTGLFFMFGPRRFPLTLHFQRGNFSFYFPLGASILISILLTLIFALFNRR